MTHEELITTLRICGNHPSMDGKSCGDCPYEKLCDPKDTVTLDLMAASAIEKLLEEKKEWLKEREDLKRYEKALEAILE